MSNVLELATATAVIAAGLAGLVYMVRASVRFARSVLSIHDLIQRELSENSGGSIKDEVAAIAVAVGGLQRDFADLTESKDLAHAGLQDQVDTLMRAMDVEDYDASHKRERQDP